jgi:pyrroline-5-carboxylate reductase
MNTTNPIGTNPIGINPTGLHLALLGGGNMAQALIQGLLRKPNQPLQLRRVTVVEPNETVRKQLLAQSEVLAQAAGIALNVLPLHAVDQGAQPPDWLLLAVKPQVAQTALRELHAVRPEWLSGSVLLSIAAGLNTEKLSTWVGHPRIVRSMPNTPALIGRGITGLFARGEVPEDRRLEAEHLLKSVGEVLWLEDEDLLDAVTAVSGSGPAYFFLLAEAMTQAGVTLGLSAAQAALLARHTAAGAGMLMAQSEDSAETLRTRVTSPGGTTAAALAVFEARGFRETVIAALEAARNRGQALSR